MIAKEDLKLFEHDTMKQHEKQKSDAIGGRK